MPPATSSASALQNLQTAQSQQQTPDQIYSGVSQSLGLPAAQQQVSGLRQAITNTTNLLNNVAPSVYGRTQDSLVTSAQAGRQIQNESAPIQQTLSGQNTSLTNDQSDLGNLLSQATTQAQLKQQGQSDSLTNLENIYKDLYGQEQDSQAEADKQAALQEQIRESNLSSASSSGGGGSGGSAKAPSAAEVKQQDQAGASQYLSSLKGGDGHVSPSTWNSAITQWMNAGYSAADFVKQFMPFINQHTGHYTGFD